MYENMEMTDHHFTVQLHPLRPCIPPIPISIPSAPRAPAARPNQPLHIRTRNHRRNRRRSHSPHRRPRRPHLPRPHHAAALRPAAPLRLAAQPNRLKGLRQRPRPPQHRPNAMPLLHLLPSPRKYLRPVRQRHPPQIPHRPHQPRRPYNRALVPLGLPRLAQRHRV